MVTRKASGVRAKFEAHWTRMHPEEFTTSKTNWLERDDIWGKGGYAQPCVHFDWLNYRAGYKAGRK